MTSSWRWDSEHTTADIKITVCSIDTDIHRDNLIQRDKGYYVLHMYKMVSEQDTVSFLAVAHQVVGEYLNFPEGKPWDKLRRTS